MGKHCKPRNVFIILAVINIFTMCIMLAISHGKALLAMGYGDSLFCDFWMHVNRVLNYENIYGNINDADAIFPPLAYIFIMFWANLVSFQNGSGTEIRDIATSGFGILILIMYLAVFIVLFVQIINYFYQDSVIYKNVVVLTLILSYPFWTCAFERGNLVIWTMLFLLSGLALRNHENRFIREFALICIAISAGFKLYPAIFGLIYIAEKRLNETIRLLLYGMLAFFTPFLFGGNRLNLIDYIGTFERYLDKNVYSHTSILGNCVLIFGDQGVIIGKIIIIVGVVWTLFYLYTEKVNWKSIALLTATNTIVLPESYLYTYVFITIPLIFFLNEKKNNWKRSDYIYAALFACIFTMPPYSLKVEGAILRGIYISWIMMLVLISIEKIYQMLKKKRRIYF